MMKRVYILSCFLFLLLITPSIAFFPVYMEMGGEEAPEPTTETWGENAADDYTSVTTSAWIEESDPNDNTNGTGYSQYVRNSSGGDRKTVILFDLSALSGKTVTDASLFLMLDTNPGGAMTVTLYSNDNTFTGQATWNCAVDTNGDGSCETSWTGTHGQNTSLDGVAFTDSSTEEIYYEWESSALTTYIDSRAGSTARLILIDETENSQTCDFRGYSEASGLRPYLEITYTD